MENRRNFGWSVFKVAAATLLVGLALPFEPVSAQSETVSEIALRSADPSPIGEGPVLVGERIPASKAIERLGNSRIVAANPGLSTEELDELATDSDVWVDARGRLLYVDTTLHTGIEDSHDEHAHESGHSDEGDFEAVAPLDDTFELESRPGSNRTIYLDFNGAVVTNTWWNDGGNSITAPAFDRDGDGANFSEYERLFIQEVWAHVAEDYAPFDVNVTTKDMGSGVYIRSSLWDNTYGSHVVITNEVVGDVCGGFSCAGVAYLDVFDWEYNEYTTPAWSFAFDYGPIYAALTISHEVGHNLGLSHDGKSSSAYYGGQGSWGPIMGGGASRPIFQWSNGDYASPTNTEDDLGVMTGNGVSFISDDYTDDAGDAGLIDLSTPIDGLISTRSDVDVFKMEISAGTLSLLASPATHSPNLDIQLDLYDATNTTLLAQSQPASSYSDTQSSRTTLTSTGMGAYLSYDSPSSQTVYVHVSGIGEGNPATSGYSDYGSLGRYTLSSSNPVLEIIVHGPGTISGTGISCSETCTYQPTAGTSVVLTATPTGDATIAYWTGACENVDFGVNQTTTCTVPMDQAREVGAVFRYNRSVTVTKSGSGTVVDDTYGWTINCGVTCSDTDWRPYVTLVATPSAGYQFGGWSGGCTHEELRCTLLMNESKNVLATFATENTLSVEVVGNGNVASNPVGIDCDGPTNGSPCDHVFDATTSVTLTATATPGQVFTGWSDDCSGTSTCTLSMNAARAVTATFEGGGTLSVNVEGAGTVTSEPEGISCTGPTGETPCTAGFLASDTVTLIATPDYMSTFDGWSGDCSGSDTCTVTMSESRSVTATFIPDYLLDVNLIGTGSGTVSADIGFINCSGDPYSTCGQYFPEGTVVTLTAADNPGFFEGWSGACTGTSRTCVVTIDESNDVTASFDQGESISLLITNGKGTVTTSAGFLSCQTSQCSGNYPTGATITLTAVPAPGYTMGGWGSACAGLGTCSYPHPNGYSATVEFIAQSPIVTGDKFSCRVAGTGAKCWGLNSSGQIGNNSLTTAKKSVNVQSLSSVAGLTAGGQHACAVLNNGTVKCWGENANGQLGNNSTTDAKTPVTVAGLSDVQSISAGAAHTCALLEGGTVKCWGSGANGRLGNGSTTDKRTPTSVSGITVGSPAVAIAAGGNFTCALMRNAGVKCWGANGSGQIGDGTKTTRNTPTSVRSLANVKMLTAGGQHACALQSTGALKCWGENGNGQLGNNSTTDSTAPVTASGVINVLAISAGTSHTCASAIAGFSQVARCWGNGANGRLGAGNTTSSRTSVVATNTSNASFVAAGGGHTCAAFGFSQYTFKCWGAGTSGQIGNNKLIDILTAVAVS